MVDWKELIKQPWFWIVTGISILALTTMVILFSHARGAGASKKEVVALKTEIGSLLDKLEQDEHAIEEARINAESKLNRLEGLLRTPHTPDERLELGEKLSEQEKRWEVFLEQGEIFRSRISENSVIDETKSKLSAANLAIDDGRNNDAMESLSKAKSMIEPLTDLRSGIEKMQTAREVYSQSKQELDILTTTYRISELPGGRELSILEKAAVEATKQGKTELAYEKWHAASQHVNEIKVRLLKGLIDASKKAVTEAIKAGDPATARSSLNRVKELTGMLEATQKLKTP